MSRRSKKKRNNKTLSIILCILIAYFIYYVQEEYIKLEKNLPIEYYDFNEIPEYSGEAYIYINNNEPYFTDEDKTTKSFEKYSDLDYLGRCNVAYANVSKDTIKCRLDLGWDLEDVFNIPYKFDRLPVNLNGQINEIRYWAKMQNCSSLDFYKNHKHDICSWGNYKVKICKYCGKQFTAKTINNKYCSNDCKYKAHRKINESNNK